MGDATKQRQPIPPECERVSAAIVDAALTVHRALGPGLLESTYETCLTHELRKRGFSVRTQVALPIQYDDMRIESAYRIDMLVDELVIVENKAVEALERVHKAQLLTYLKLSKLRLGLLINFNEVLLRTGVRRFVNSSATAES